MPVRQRRLNSAILIFSGFFLSGMAVWAFAGSEDFEGMKRKVRATFPDVPQLATADLAAWLSDPRRVQPVLLDVRTEKEFAVSHLAGAVRVEPSATAEEILPRLPAGRPVVAYCSVGYRSSAVAERLNKAGTQVSNLEGSIFQWANEGRRLEAGGQPREKVHPYNAKYGRLLDKKRRAAP